MIRNREEKKTVPAFILTPHTSSFYLRLSMWKCTLSTFAGPAGTFSQHLTSDFVTLSPKSLPYRYAWISNGLKTVKIACQLSARWPTVILSVWGDDDFTL